MNRHRGLLLAGVAAAVFGGLLPSAWGGCVGPELEIVKPAAQRDRPARLIVGTSVSARGRFWINGCNDTGGGSTLCSQPPEPEDPITNIEFRIIGPVTKKLERQYRQGFGGGRPRFSRVVGKRDADTEGRFQLSFTVPKLPEGHYYLWAAEIGDPELVRILPADSRRS
jgi:hypothetical protein